MQGNHIEAALAKAWEEPVNQMHFKFVTQLYNNTNAESENAVALSHLLGVLLIILCTA